MFWFLYNILFHIVYLLMLPHFLLRMRRRGGYRKGFFQRLFRLSEEERGRVSDGRKIWVHAVSVGELSVGLAYMREWRSREPEVSFLVTVNTSTARRIAEEKLHDRDVLLYPPLDSPWVIRKLLRTVDLRSMVLVETEMWPNTLRLLKKHKIPVMLLNGRISDRSYGRLKKVPFFTRRLYPLVTRYCMQSDRDAKRAIALGAPAEAVKVMFSAKYDVVQRNRDEEVRRQSRLLAAGFATADSVILLGSSTWPGEEKALMKAFTELRERYQNLRLILVPRHFERRNEVLADAKDLGLKMACWSDASDEALREAEVVMVDTTGELSHFTGFADRVFIGKSLFRSEGQNPLEAAHAGKWIVTGQGMNNFHQIIEDLRIGDAVIQVRDEEELTLAIGDSLADPEQAREQGERAQELVERRKGSIVRSADEFAKMI